MNIGSCGNYGNGNESYNSYPYDGYYQNYSNTGNDIGPYPTPPTESAHYQPPYYNCQSYYVRNDKVYQKNCDDLMFRKHYEGEGIITSDNGLSYTNLDSYQMYNNNNNKKSVKIDSKTEDKTNWYANEEIGQFIQCNGSEFENFNLHYIKDDFQTEVWGAGNHIVDELYTQTVQNQKNNRLQNVGNRCHDVGVGKTVPTYKWMQVKRNVPKPNGKIQTKSDFFCRVQIKYQTGNWKVNKSNTLVAILLKM
ncbi:hypothetical protein RUM44_005242 [Polyplax serrata]|uniref:Uncharacterized protein n=1 Tax=Polyplax serrata TaxID=468196 RepID=A0ABR1AEG1_POLSC